MQVLTRSVMGYMAEGWGVRGWDVKSIFKANSEENSRYLVSPIKCRGNADIDILFPSIYVILTVCTKGR
jgi:hypothetical protein